MGRFIIRAIVAFQDLHSIFNEGVIRVNANWPDDPDEKFDDSKLEGFQIPLESETSGFNHDISAYEYVRRLPPNCLHEWMTSSWPTDATSYMRGSARSTERSQNSPWRLLHQKIVIILI